MNSHYQSPLVPAEAARSLRAPLTAAPIPVLALLAALAAALAGVPAEAEDGNLEQRLLLEQNKSQFQLKLEQARERALARARQRRSTAPAQTGFSSSVKSLDDADKTLRLMGDATPASAPGEPPSDLSLDIRNREQREQLRQITLDEQQRRRSLTLDDGPRASAESRRRLSGFRSEQKQRSFQRKLSR